MVIIICQAHLLADPLTIPLLYNLVLWNNFLKKQKKNQIDKNQLGLVLSKQSYPERVSYGDSGYFQVFTLWQRGRVAANKTLPYFYRGTW